MPSTVSAHLCQWICCHAAVPASRSLDWTYLWLNAMFDCKLPEAERCESADEFRALLNHLGVQGLAFR